MENWWICLLLCLPWAVGVPDTIVKQTHSQESGQAEELPLSVKFNPSGILYSQENGHLIFGCEINRNLTYVTKNKISIIRRSAIKGTEAIVSQFPENLNKDNNYITNPQPVQGNGVLINITISKVRDLDEGTFICRVQDSSGITEEDDLNIELKKPLKNVSLEFNGSSRISKTLEDPFEVFAGNYSVICFAIGGNPAPTVNLFLNGSEAECVHKHTEPLATKLKEYKTTIDATISIKFAIYSQEIKCNGTTDLEDKHSVMIYVKTKIRDPDINCSETKAQKGQKHPVLICTVQYEGVNITNFAYDDGAHTFNFHSVQIGDLSGTKKWVNLTLDEAEDWHFQDFYLLLNHSDGHITRVSIKLHDSKGQSNSFTSVQFLLATLFVAFIIWLIL